MSQMATYEAGTLLTCGHEGCGCRVRIEVPCHCSGAGEGYRCTCGDALTPWSNASGRSYVRASARGSHRPNVRPVSSTPAASRMANAEMPTAAA